MRRSRRPCGMLSRAWLMNRSLALPGINAGVWSGNKKRYLTKLCPPARRPTHQAAVLACQEIAA
jgi:hypothetical protein